MKNHRYAKIQKCNKSSVSWKTEPLLRNKNNTPHEDRKHKSIRPKTIKKNTAKLILQFKTKNKNLLV